MHHIMKIYIKHGFSFLNDSKCTKLSILWDRKNHIHLGKTDRFTSALKVMRAKTNNGETPFLRSLLA